MLVDAGCELNVGARSRQAANQTALHFAVRHSHHEVAKLLIDAGCDVNMVRGRFSTEFSERWTISSLSDTEERNRGASLA